VIARNAKIGEFREESGISDQGDHHPPLVQVESNVEEWPVFQLGRSKSNSARVEQTITGEDGSELQQRLEVSAPGKYRLPGRFDYDVYSAVLELLEIRGGMPEDGTLGFSLHELILIMGLRPSGRTYEEVRRSLRRIAATVLESDNAFWSKGQQRHISDTFNLWNVRFDSITDKNGSGSRHEIEFGKLFRRSFEEHYLRGLDIEFFWELDSPVAKRLYRLVDLKRDGAASWRTDLFDLQRRIPIGPYGYVSKIKEKLSAAHEELIERGFLAGVYYEGKRGINYAVSEVFRDRRKGLELAGTKEEIIAIKLLTESGLRGDVARDLVAKHGPAHCTRYANALPYQRNLRNPAGWLRKAIEQGYELDAVPEQPALPDRTEPPAKRPGGDGHAAETKTSAEPRPRGEPEPADASGEREDEGAPEQPAPDPGARDAWRALAADLSALRGREALPPWWDQYEGGELEGSTLTVLVPNSTAANHLNDNFGEDLSRLWRERAGVDAVVQVATELASERRAPLRGSA
jgi:hypothetical protein